MFLIVFIYVCVDIYVYLFWLVVCIVYRFINLLLNILKYIVKLYLSVLIGIDVYIVDIYMNSYCKYRCVKSFCMCM